VNTWQKKILFRKVLRYYNGNLIGKIIAVWGLAFKPQTDDMREAPSIDIIHSLLNAGAKVKAHDPIAMNRARSIFGTSIEYSENAYDTLKNADALMIVTEWNEFRKPDFQKMKSLMRKPVIFDGRNVYDPKIVNDFGLEYFGIGRGSKI
ncbi:MAG: UDP-glucose 6-dehydrogenase, partial [Bacteroidetes bacterium]|nr:UDP-glucose 6-dehydrogenase [Bacteroidota bacterium]